MIHWIQRNWFRKNMIVRGSTPIIRIDNRVFFVILVYLDKFKVITRMHSSRVRTARLLPVSPSMHCSGGCTCPGGVYLPRYSPCGQTDTCNDITFVCGRAVLTKDWIQITRLAVSHSNQYTKFFLIFVMLLLNAIHAWVILSNSSNSSNWMESANVSRNWQYKYVYRKIRNNQHHTCILEANYYLFT